MMEIVSKVALLALTLTLVAGKPAGENKVADGLQGIDIPPDELKVESNAPSLNIDVESIDYLSRLGYYARPDPKSGRLMSIEEIQKSVRSLQEYGGIKVTGIIDAATKELIEAPRCGMPDFGTADNNRRKRRYTLQGTSWRKTSLTWRLVNDNNDGLTRSVVEQALHVAFGKWHAITNLDFTKINSGLADIEIKFVTAYHYDSYPFDGPGGTLAHGFYPHNNVGLSGDIHFDDDEQFTLGTTQGKNFLWVAVHEIGHAIGLEHSDVREAIMYPWYKGYKGVDFDLTYDDKLGIQNIYGSRASVTVTPGVTAPATAPPQPGQKACISSVKAIFLDPSTLLTYVINDDKVYVLGKSLGVEKGPIAVETMFPNVDYVDSAYTARNGEVVVLQGQEYFTYRSVADNRLIKSGSIYDKFNGLPTSVDKIDAAFVWKRNGRTYLFAGDKYFRFNEYRGTIDSGYPRNIVGAWVNIPTDVDAVFVWSNHATYFFKGDQFYRFDDEKIRLRDGYPRDTIKPWFKCTQADIGTVESKASIVVVSYSAMLSSLLMIALTKLTH